MAAEPIAGTLAAAVTPLREGGRRLDEDAFAPLLEFYAASGIDGLLVLGTTGEGILLSTQERRRFAEAAVAGAGGLRVIVHCGAQTTDDTAALAAHAAQAGADGVAVIAPPYFAFTDRELVAHFTAAAAVCAPLPFYIYEYAERSGYSVPADVVMRVRDQAPNLVGMKVSDAPFASVEPYLSLGLDVFIGAEAVIREGRSAGAVGAVSGVAGAFPEVVASLVDDSSAERAAAAESVRAALSLHSFQASVKAALALRGVPIRGDVRAPLLPLVDAEREQLAAALHRALGAGVFAPQASS